ncbi:HK97 gp10 family phage protein [Sphingomonas sp. MMS24-J13]|uniref:HK97 gp10 family phage protein n=1 Tax=Sphingomonas sp. MMS24-J13 TaxID=3238686 RepID=UPI00384EBBBA
MATSRGRAEVSQFLKDAPSSIRRILIGAGRAGAKVIADEAKQRVTSDEVRGSIKTTVKEEKGRIVAKVQTKGKGAYIAPWLEHGTAPHFISVAADQRRGLSIGKVNERVKEGSLVIGGKFVGETVHHPGARPHPFLRPALDMKEQEAVQAAQNYINSKVALMKRGAQIDDVGTDE